MAKTKTCPNCQKVNAANALACLYCGAGFAAERTKTVQLTDSPVGQSRLDQVEQLSAAYKDAFIIFMAHRENPILVTHPGAMIVIGRYSPSEGSLTVDLEEFDGAHLGVSRRHAVIKRDADGFKLYDKESKNGTWLNGVRIESLVPHVIRSGDEIRFGQMITHVYFNRPSDRIKSFMLFNVRQATASLASSRLTYLELQEGVVPFMRAISDTQVVINEMLELPQRELVVDAIVADKQSSTITVTLDGASETITLLRDMVMPWKRSHRPILETGGEAIGPELQELVLKLVESIKADLAPETKKTFIHRLLPLFQTFVFSDYELSIEQPMTES